MVRKAIAALARVNDALGRFAKNLTAGMLVVMLVIVMLQVVFRYLLNSPIGWAEEVSKTLMVWSAFLLAPVAYREGINVSIDLFADALPALLRRILEIVITLLVLWIVCIFLLESLPLVERAMKVSAASLPVPKGVFYAILPLSFAWLVLATIERLLILATDFPVASPADSAEA